MCNYFKRFWRYLDSKFGIPKENRYKSLPMRIIEDEDNISQYFWEDWHAEMKVKYPIRHWIFNEFNIWASVTYRCYVEDPIYWFESKFIKKEHLIDLRGAPIGTYEEEYCGGYISYPDIIELSTYKAFKKFTNSLYKRESDLDSIIGDYEDMLKGASVFDNSSIINAIKFYKKVKRIDYFFEIELRGEYANSLRFLSGSHELSKDDRHELYAQHRKFDKMLEQKITWYLCEIIKLRIQIRNYS